MAETKRRQGNVEGSKRGPYKRAQLKATQKEVQEGGLSHQEIGKMMDLSAGEVKRIEEIALKKLRRPSEANTALRKYKEI